MLSVLSLATISKFNIYIIIVNTSIYYEYPYNYIM